MNDSAPRGPSRADTVDTATSCARCPSRDACRHLDRVGPAVADLAEALALLRTWHDLSLATTWRNAGDWHHPAAEAFAEALVTGCDPLPRAARLGSARAMQGVGIGEALEDLAHAYAVLGTTPPPDVTRAAAVGWVEVIETAAVQPALVDPLSGLFTIEYLRARVRETYLHAEPWALLVVDVGLAGLRAPERFERAAAVGDTLTAVFGPGHPMANVDDGLFVVLVRRDGDLGDRIDEVRRRVVPFAGESRQARVMRHPAHVWIEQLPGAVTDVPDLLSSLRG